MAKAGLSDVFCQRLVEFINLTLGHKSLTIAAEVKCTFLIQQVCDWPSLHLRKIFVQNFAWNLVAKHVQPSCFEGSKLSKQTKLQRWICTVLQCDLTTYIPSHCIPQEYYALLINHFFLRIKSFLFVASVRKFFNLYLSWQLAWHPPNSPVVLVLVQY